MSPIVIVTDSASDIDQALITELGIEIVPLKVSFGAETFLDGITMRSNEFFERLRSSDVFPRTSQPSPVEFSQKFQDISDKHGADVCIIAILLSSQLSGTYQSAVIGKGMLEQELDLTIIDSKKGAMFEGLLVVEAAKMARAGCSKQQILDEVDRMIGQMQNFFIIDTLEFLQKGGRIGRASAFIGSLLNIKPILSLDANGAVYAFDKVRGNKKAVARMMDELKSYAADARVKVAIMHANALEEAKALKERVTQEFQVIETYISEIGPVIGAHIGPGGIACAMVKE
ncbi:DegV family protein [Brevibacillus laterosporus]|uniref:DegV family protein n=1 Tax=Brevibacillus laterosporus TaxID=1465 RepID=UPI0018CD0374|nr:DegV family protein [Brevibacillus laterosporus]MBG9788197.1 hypothetical protein [Brevibacillus laterosporus]